MCISLAFIVGLLKSLLKGRIAVWIHSTVNTNFADREFVCGNTAVKIPLQWLAGYMAITAGAGITVLVQSSSITTCALTPLVGLGVVNIERTYPLVIGANLGTTVTGILSALSQSGSEIAPALQTAFAHLFFNISGMVLFYVIWPMRRFPISGAKFLGNTTAEYRWFALAYILTVFLVLPGIFVGLSIAGPVAFFVFFIPALLFGLFVIVVNYMQERKKEYLPIMLHTWEFLPLYMRSLEPIDRVFCHNAATERCCGQKYADNKNGSESWGDDESEKPLV